MAFYDEIYEVAADNYGLISNAQAKKLGVSDKELSRLTKDGRLERVGHGIYRIFHHVPEPNDPYALAVMCVGPEAYLYGESVIAMHGLASTNPTRMFVATPKRVRKKLPKHLHVVRRGDRGDVSSCEGIPSQTIIAAIKSCKGTMMPERLIEATRNARTKGLITADEEAELMDFLEASK